MHISLSWEVFNNGGCLLGHTDASKAECIHCGKLLSLGSNKLGKQTVHGLKCHLEKYHKDIYTLYMKKVESRQQGPPAKRRNWTRYWRRIVGLTWWLNVWKLKKTLILSGDFRFLPKMNVYFRFVFGRKWNFIFVGIFVFSRKWKILFGRLLVYITKRSWSWDAKFCSWSWKKSLITSLVL